MAKHLISAAVLTIALVSALAGRANADDAIVTDANAALQSLYAFIFDQRGLMAGLGIQGSKITRLEK
jgi:lipid-binding SYLF domain-containing protein